MSKKDVSPSDISVSDFSIFDGLFTRGYTQSAPLKVLSIPEENLDLIVVYRTLSPLELRDIFEEVFKFNSTVGQAVTEQLETLARAIVTINGQPLAMAKPDVDKFYEAHKRYPSPLEMARYVIKNKIMSIPVLDTLYGRYNEYASSIVDTFDDLKKKSEEKE